MPPRLTTHLKLLALSPRLSSPCPPLCRRLTIVTASTTSDPLNSQKAQKAILKAAHKRKTTSFTATDTPWQITCGLEVHAQLNTERKLFSAARTSVTAPPNTHISPIDASLPGVQPTLNPSVLLPAIRAALSFSCTINTHSRFDRKHYFYWDQPAGYQITQYYSPLAARGHFTLTPAWDGVDTPIQIGIRQVQLEQDTGKTLSAPPNNLVDLNRVGAPLVEIITDPFPIEDSEIAGKALAKIQAYLKAVDACVLGMEWGGLRADVNVSVAPRGSSTLGQRCEIKNLSSFKAVTDAVAAEAKRQISLLESGKEIVGETRGWDAEKGVTTRLRGKEGEVDYRYMPEPDLPPVDIAENAILKIQETVQMLPEEAVEKLVNVHGITWKDARTMLALDDGRPMAEGGVMEFFTEVTKVVQEYLENQKKHVGDVGRVAGNWVLHELWGLLTVREIEWKDNPVDAARMAQLLGYLLADAITGPTAKKLLPRLLTSPETPAEIIKRENLAVQNHTDDQLAAIVDSVLATPKGTQVLEQLMALNSIAGPKGDKKRMGVKSYFIGATMKELKGTAQAKVVEQAVNRVLKEKGVALN
ncbi:Glutamyl-tRNA amidotransferase B subunit [Ascodesmis nigricans]|uniref:Glutamyl-tRNA(Gln) amidotransferase subunit B, mitochondrial n=1 Tax=Ascodesmis nigricans TaxID=341454 RepID=A0A4S2N6X7_9PEZI|nr:Glutamyl-tRNA amidotransferase B subunit [Ascodesmis nigricans]